MGAYYGTWNEELYNANNPIEGSILYEDPYGREPMHIAALQGHVNWFDRLFLRENVAQYISNADYDDFTVLHYIALSSNTTTALQIARKIINICPEMVKKLNS